MIGWREYRRPNIFVHPYWRRLAVILGIGTLSTLLGLTQPFISKLLIDDALLRRDWTRLWQVAGLMLGATVLGFALNILSSYQYVRVSAAMLFDMRIIRVLLPSGKSGDVNEPAFLSRAISRLILAYSQIAKLARGMATGFGWPWRAHVDGVPRDVPGPVRTSVSAILLSIRPSSYRRCSKVSNINIWPSLQHMPAPPEAPSEPSGPRPRAVSFGAALWRRNRTWAAVGRPT